MVYFLVHGLISQNFFSGYNAALFLDLVDSIESSWWNSEPLLRRLRYQISLMVRIFILLVIVRSGCGFFSDIFVLGFGTGINPTDSYFTNSVFDK